ncbi:MAG: lytic transglycosylase domain-containing protein [Mesorhizobium sp.]|nr:MAG: lytic transglycosylase domain-containing protein [Mesorhizobium sp.]RWL92404.1 MAG: lytic transglycosylase domain-containing protein [Mesorhizobium sp.]
MKKSPALWLMMTALAAPVSAWAGGVPVIDGANLTEKTVRKDKTNDIEKVDKDRNSINKSVTCSMFRPGRKDDPVSAANANPEIAGLVKRVAREEGVDEDLFMSLVYQESRFNPCAKSEAGAIGLSQLMPGTAADLGVNPYNIEQNLRGGARYLKQQLKRFGGNTNLALAAYNSGHGNVQKYGGIPPFKETQGYVKRITQQWLPAFGGSNGANIPLNYGGGDSAYTGMRDSTINAMATSQATQESTGNVASWLQQLGGLNAGTIQDSWDHNSGARNANLEMMNQVILLGTTMADLFNSRNASQTSEVSGSSQSANVKEKDDENPLETTGICDPRTGLEWSPFEKACVQKRERKAKVKLQLQPQ